MAVLAIETCLEPASVAVLKGEIRAQLYIGADTASELAHAVQRVMSQSGIRPSDLNRIAVTVGPGSFTGIRTGVALANAMALALEIPIFTLTSLELLARSGGNVTALAFIDAYHDKAFAQAFDKNHKPLDEPRLLALAEIQPRSFKNIGVILSDKQALLDKAGTNFPGVPTACLQGLADALAKIASSMKDIAGLAQADAFYFQQPSAKKLYD